MTSRFVGNFPNTTAFEWDELKNRLNVAKHGIDFDDAVGVFDAPTFFSAQTATTRNVGSR